MFEHFFERFAFLLRQVTGLVLVVQGKDLLDEASLELLVGVHRHYVFDSLLCIPGMGGSWFSFTIPLRIDHWG